MAFIAPIENIFSIPTQEHGNEGEVESGIREPNSESKAKALDSR